MLRKIWLFGLLAIVLTALISWSFANPQKQEKGKKTADRAPVILAHISDTHLGLERAPDAAENLRNPPRLESQIACCPRQSRRQPEEPRFLAQFLGQRLRRVPREIRHHLRAGLAAPRQL